MAPCVFEPEDKLLNKKCKTGGEEAKKMLLQAENVSDVSTILAELN